MDPRFPHKGAYAVAFTLIAGSGCMLPSEAVTNRATRELGCPQELLNVIQRCDIADNVFDIEGCGSRARYSCVNNADSYGSTFCAREPDPRAWDPDPALARSFARYYGGSPFRRTCRDEDDDQGCLFRDHDRWSWRSPDPTTGSLVHP